jgi:uncharacterized HAD superfamily protein
MDYRTVAQLSDQVWTWSLTLPRDLEVIVGAPPGGLLAANLLALYRNLPLADVEGLFAGRIATGGRRLRKTLDEDPLLAGRKVLVVADSVPDRGGLRALRERIAAAALPHTVSYGGVYVVRDYRDQVDFAREVLDRPALFEWNFMQTEKAERFCMDIDGVLCLDSTAEMKDDGPRYEEFLACARPLYLPDLKVGWLVTSRLEKYRRQTEEWLARHGVQYGELIMMDLPDMQARRSSKARCALKAEVYRETGADLFYESELSQAIQIANLTLKPVLCVDTRQMIYPGLPPHRRERQRSGKQRNYLAAARRRLGRAVARLRNGRGRAHQANEIS